MKKLYHEALDKMKSKTLCFLFCLFGLQATALYAQNIVSGTITEEENGMPLAGVNILEEGTSNGTCLLYTSDAADELQAV